MTDTIAEFGRRLVAQVKRDDVLGLSAELAYRFFLSVFPFAIFIAGLGSVIASWLDVQNPAQLAKDQLTGLLPPEAASLIGQELQRIIENQRVGVASFGMIAAIWFATGGTNAVIKAMNRAFDVDETRPFWQRYLLAIGLTLLAGAALIAAFVLFIVGQLLAGGLASDLGVGDAALTAINVLRWPVAGVLLFLAVAVMYRVGPNLRLRLTWIVPGAMLFTVGWLVFTFAFGLYVSNFSNYGATFGALAGVAILMIWFYLTALILLVGAEVNDVIAEMAEPGQVHLRRKETAARGDVGPNRPMTIRSGPAPASRPR